MHASSERNQENLTTQQQQQNNDEKKNKIKKDTSQEIFEITQRCQREPVKCS